MKTANIFTLLTLLFFLGAAKPVSAQWLQNPSYIWTFNKSLNVGVGTNVPAEAKFVVRGAVGSSTALFGQGAQGVSITQNWPGVGFNAYHTPGGWRAMADGHGMALTCDPNNGKVILFQHQFAGANQPCTQTAPFVVEPNGNVGIGCDYSAAGKLDIQVKPDNLNQANVRLTGSDPWIAFDRNRDGVQMGFVRAWADNSHLNGFGARKGIEIGTPPGEEKALLFSTNYTQRMTIDHDGRVTIGESWPARGYLLSVNGNVICQELRVQLRDAWPDYVFASGYKLKPLSEVAAHISEAGHLPNIPSACEIEESGISVGEMQVKMMEKIEEITLYLIDQEKQIAELKSANEALQRKINQLETNK